LQAKYQEHRLAGGGLMLYSSMRPFVRLLPNLWTLFWKQMKCIWCKLPCGPHGNGMKRSILEVTRSRSHEAKDRHVGLTEASFLTHLGQIAF